ncbi:MAG: hypothetical protein HC840_10915 [Leptolyngbyaceae cyanobacterium RM2_2_4]|nr:hypothetical protein [Leptolyngbyaceae cyanobacterium RM2_2_4]
MNDQITTKQPREVFEDVFSDTIDDLDDLVANLNTSVAQLMDTLDSDSDATDSQKQDVKEFYELVKNNNAFEFITFYIDFILYGFEECVKI